jgi:hypothetical protein
MTQARIPDTFTDAMANIIVVIGAGEAARIATEVARRSPAYAERTMYDWSHPDTGSLPTLRQALAFDAAYQAAGGEGAPFRDAFAQQLENAVEAADACRRTLVTESATFVREAAEVTEALFHAAQPGASPHAIHRALVEAQQVERAARPLRRRLASFLRTAIRASAGKAGGDQK